MAIQFARMEFGSRSSGANACHKSSYNSRDSVRDENTGRLYDFSSRKDLLHHEIMLPENANEKFLDKQYLWNAIEQAEKRTNSQVYMEFVLALPGNKEVSNEDRIELTRRFGKELSGNGFVTQIDLHSPHKDTDKNHHAHVICPTRYLTEDGESIGKKARDYVPQVRNGYVVEGINYGEKWRDIQNEYFREKGYEIRVDTTGIIPQVHIGAKRLRDMDNENVYRNEDIKSQNAILAKDTGLVLEQIVKERSVFNSSDVERFLSKHARGVDNNLVKEIMNLGNVQQLHDKHTGEILNKYTTIEVRHQEERLFRFLDKIDNPRIGHRGVIDKFYVSSDTVKAVIDNQKFELSEEQKAAISYVTNSDSGLKIVQGRAGSGKTAGVITPVREIYESAGYNVVGLAPTNKVVEDLRDSGFSTAMSCHKMLFRAKNGYKDIDSNTVVIIDEAGMVDTQAWLEMANVFKKSGAKVVAVGDDRQLQSIERGGVNIEMTNKYGSVSVEEVHRQRFEYSKEISRSMADGNWNQAVSLMDKHELITWSKDKESALAQLVTDYSRDSLKEPNIDRFIIAQRNVDVDKLNRAIHDLRVERGEVGKNEFVVKVKEDLSGEYNPNDIKPEEKEIRFGVGDRVQFVKTAKGLHVNNGSFGTLRMATEDKFVVALDNGKTVSFNPHEYDGLRLGYAGTIYRGQGSTFVDIYALHDSATNNRNSYVIITRNKDFCKVYANYEDTKDLGELVKQMAHSDTRESSLAYATAQDLTKSDVDGSISGRAKEFIGAMGTKLGDMFHSNDKFYELDIKNINVESIEKSSFVFDVSDRCLTDTIKILNYVYSNEYKQSKQSDDGHGKSIVIDKKEQDRIYSKAVDVSIMIHDHYGATGLGVSLDKISEFEKSIENGFKVDRKLYELELSRLTEHDREVKQSIPEKELQDESFAERMLGHSETLSSKNVSSKESASSEAHSSDMISYDAKERSTHIWTTDSSDKGTQKVDNAKSNFVDIGSYSDTSISLKNTKPSVTDFDMKIVKSEDMKIANGISAYRRVGKDNSGISLSKHELNNLCRDAYSNINVDSLIRSIGNRDYVFNEKMSSGSQLRYGSLGELSINTETGLWNNFATGEGGTLTLFVQNELNVGFKGAMSHMRQFVNNRSISDRLGSFLGDSSINIDYRVNAERVEQGRAEELAKSERLAQHKQEKILSAQEIFSKSVAITGTQAEEYLLSRNTQDINTGTPSINIRYLPSGTKFNYNGKDTTVYNGAMVVASRDNENNIVGVQLTYLENGAKQVGRDGIVLNKFQYGVLKDGLVQVSGNYQTHTKQLLNNDKTTDPELHKGLHSSISENSDPKSYKGVNCYISDNADSKLYKGTLTSISENETVKNTGVMNSDLKNTNRTKEAAYQELKLPHSEKLAIVCEGVETALSIKEAVITKSNKDNIDIYASNGISNLANVADRGYSKLLICGDYDGADAKSTVQTEKVTESLRGKDIYVEVVYPETDINNPDKKLDFNDVLSSENGIEKIQNTVLPAMEKLSPELLPNITDNDKVFEQKNIIASSEKSNNLKLGLTENGSYNTRINSDSTAGDSVQVAGELGARQETDSIKLSSENQTSLVTNFIQEFISNNLNIDFSKQSEFFKKYDPEISYINFEDDDGIEDMKNATMITYEAYYSHRKDHEFPFEKPDDRYIDNLSSYLMDYHEKSGNFVDLDIFRTFQYRLNYEQQRIPEIMDRLIDKWDDQHGDVNEFKYLRAETVANYISKIESRIVSEEAINVLLTEGEKMGMCRQDVIPQSEYDENSDNEAARIYREARVVEKDLSLQLQEDFNLSKEQSDIIASSCIKHAVTHEQGISIDQIERNVEQSNYLAERFTEIMSDNIDELSKIDAKYLAEYIANYEHEGLEIHSYFGDVKDYHEGISILATENYELNIAQYQEMYEERKEMQQEEKQEYEDELEYGDDERGF